MNKNLIKSAAIVIGLIFVGTWLHYTIQASQLRRQLRQANDYILGQDSTITWASGQYESRGREIKSLRQFNKVLEDSIPELANRLEVLGRRLQSHIQLVAYYEGVLDSGVAVIDTSVSGAPRLSLEVVQDWGKASLLTILEDSTLYARTSLEVATNGIQMQYWLDSRFREYFLDINIAPVTIHTTVSQDASGNWIANYVLPEYLTLGRNSLTIHPERLSLSDRISLTAGVSTKPGVLMGVGYNGWSLGILFIDDAYWTFTRTVPLSWIFGKR